MLDQMESRLGSEEAESEEDLSKDTLWQSTAEQGPSEQNMRRLLAVYRAELVERYRTLLAHLKQEKLRL